MPVNANKAVSDEGLQWEPMHIRSMLAGPNDFVRTGLAEPACVWEDKRDTCRPTAFQCIEPGVWTQQNHRYKGISHSDKEDRPQEEIRKGI